MVDYDWPYLTRGRAIVLILALIGMGWLIFRTMQPTPTVLSLWPGPMGGNSVQQSTGLSSVFQPTGQGLSAGSLRPQGNPLGVANTVMTQGYGVGTHAPAHIWGAIDLAIDGTGNGRADPDATWGHPIYATHAGTVKVSRDTWPAGNHVWIVNEQYRTGYAHLQDFAVQTGQVVERGQKIGTVGSTGQSSGPHLDYQVWQMQNGQWVNLNPLDFGVFDGVR